MLVALIGGTVASAVSSSVSVVPGGSCSVADLPVALTGHASVLFHDKVGRQLAPQFSC